MPEKVILNDGREYIEYSFVEIEIIRLQREINRQVKFQRPSRAKSVFDFTTDYFSGRKQPNTN